MKEVYCQYCGCKEVADNIINIKYKKNDYMMICNKHLIALCKKKNTTLSGVLIPKRIRMTNSLRESLRRIRKIKNFNFLLDLREKGVKK